MIPLQIVPAEASPPYLRTRAPVALAEGFYEEETDGEAFRWMRQSGRMTFAPEPAPRYLEVRVFTPFEDLSQELTVECGGERQTIHLCPGWAPVSFVAGAGAGEARFTVNKPFPRAYYPADTRELSIRMRPPLLHRDAVRHGHIERQHANAVRNVTEMLEGRANLTSTPPTLGIDLHGVCNVKPPCVYCEWDHSKKLEADHVDTPFTVDTLREWGEFFDNSGSLINCSIGEPFMMKNLDELLEVFGNTGKALEMTTNGQILTDRNIQRLIGRPIDLYVSLDAGTPETYAKLRNRRFDSILFNLRRLIEAKGGPGARPHVYLVFMPMRVNVHELEAFTRICADLRVDRMVLRPLNYSPSVNLDWQRSGYRFEYQRELLPFDELVRVSGRAAALCEQLGVPLSDQMDFGGSLNDQFNRYFEEGRRSVAGAAKVHPAPPPEPLAPSSPVDAVAAAPAPIAAAGPLPSLGSERKPVCTEPWKSLYILRRGVLPCCYGAEAVAPLEQYREAWNSQLLQDVRAELAQGRFHGYCLRSTTCPIVRKAEKVGALPRRQAAYVRARRIWARVDQLTDGRAAIGLHYTRNAAKRARLIALNPAYELKRAARQLRGTDK